MNQEYSLHLNLLCTRKIKAISFASFKLKLRRRRNFTAHSCVAAWGHTSKLPYICILVDSSQVGNLMIPALTASKLASESFKNQGILIRYTGAARTLIFWKIHLQLVLFVFLAACTLARASNMNCWQARIPLCLHASTGGCDARTNPALFSVVVEGEVLRGISVWFILPYTNNTNYLGNLLETLTWIKGITLPNHHLRWPRLRSL